MILPAARLDAAPESFVNLRVLCDQSLSLQRHPEPFWQARFTKLTSASKIEGSTANSIY
jgi:hypothetical protein